MVNTKTGEPKILKECSLPLTGRKVAAKYKHPKTGQTWSGRGSTPVWIREAEASGVKRETFVIKRRKG